MEIRGNHVDYKFGMVCEIPCKNYKSCYIGQTGQKSCIRISYHKGTLTDHDVNLKLFQQCLNNHAPDFEKYNFNP